ncbi:glutathione S-transferase C-terminal domain-containing protein [Cognatiyoonia sp. IB215446]|uniref:glutathione S-transferase C-terminal domain-containing protein n=1 Tax=Cognatiyoonia sp. IB215446 TaxID=3097355 RepID=UPI002A11C997|nr:glutathione S-transferase C-terminal domain-containing protein [Cognatiyoonia sp. IB215446]MDX8350475.1 glutathione S-transferase C-terminal domain-containing protein [Cognatiyoonia sp. IB215446]
MGMLVDGHWSTEDRTIKDGAYVRPKAPFAEAVPDHVIKGIADEPGRYHLIASFSCPWSHRLTLVRAIKGLNDLLPVHIATGPRTQGYRMGSETDPWRVPGTDVRIEHLHELYTQTDQCITARATVPVLWDAVEKTIVSNESARVLPALDLVEIDQDFEAYWTLAPTHLLDDMRALSERVQTQLSNAVYRAGKARRQDIYEAAVQDVFATLDALEDRLSKSRYLHGLALTETDLRLWPTLARFDQVYVGHFKCTRKRLVDYPNLWGYARDIYSLPGVAETFEPTAIRHAYYNEDLEINPSGVIAVAPDLDWHLPHDRWRLGARQVWMRDGQCRPAEVESSKLQGGAPRQ